MVDISNLATCAEDSRHAALDKDPSPADPTNFFSLRERLEAYLQVKRGCSSN